MLASFLSGEFLLNTLSAGLIFYVGSFSYTSHAVLIFMQGVSYTSRPGVFFFSGGSFSYWHIQRCLLLFFFSFFLFIWGVSLTHPMLALFLSGKFLLHILCLLYFSLGSFSETSLAGFFSSYSIWGVFSYASGAGFSFTLGVSFTVYPMHALFSVRSFSYMSHNVFFLFLIWGVSLTHPMLALFFIGVFLLHIPCWLHFDRGSFSSTSRAGFFSYFGCFSYTPRAGFIFIWGVSLTHPTISSFFFLIWGVSLTHPMLASF